MSQAINSWTDSNVASTTKNHLQSLDDLTPASNPAQIVFVPGNWHTLHHVQPLVTKISTTNFKMKPLQLASVGRKDPRPTFADDVNGIKDAVLEKLDRNEDVVLVLHSYAGMPGSEAVNQLIDLGALEPKEGKGKLRRVVYIAACMFPAGFIMDPKMFIREEDPMFSIDFNTGFSSFADPYFGFFNDMSREDAQPFIDNIGETYYLGQGPCISSDKYRELPLLYVETMKDQAMPMERQVGFSHGMPRVRLDTGHDPFISQPQLVADILCKIAMSE